MPKVFASDVPTAAKLDAKLPLILITLSIEDT
jgi:hypothetical protein